MCVCVGGGDMAVMSKPGRPLVGGSCICVCVWGGGMAVMSKPGRPLVGGSCMCVCGRPWF